MATTVVNGASNAEGNTSGVAMPNLGRQQPKSGNFNNKNADVNRKPTGVSNDGAQRRNTPQKAWTSGMNPITQRSTTPAQQNGAPSHAKSSQQRAMASQEFNTTDKYANDRLMFLLGNSLGLTAFVTVKNGDVFSGIFFGADLETQEPAYLLKMVQQVKTGIKAEVNGGPEVTTDYIGIGEEYAMSFELKEVAGLAVEGVTYYHKDKSQNGSQTGFRTDADISGNMAPRERNLQRWEPAAETDVDLSLEKSAGTWDQFQANEEKFGLKSDYDESIYTTRIDRTDPLYRQREAEAQRIAQEIEGTTASNAHMREERGMPNEDDEYNEEEKYSNVRRPGTDYPPLRSSQGNKYMPPARRPPTGKPTVAGAPVDPAIISSQIARPDAAPQGQPKEPTDSTEVEKGSSNTKDATYPEPSIEVSSLAAGKDVVANNLRQSGSSKATIPSASATANVETEVLDSFRQFASFEKMRVSDHRRQRVTQDKAIKLNDLMKFSKNFTLKTPVPKDLVPILAKDKLKQEKIMENALRNAEKKSDAPPKPTTSTGSDLNTLRTTAEMTRGDTRIPPSNGDREDSQNSRQAHLPPGPQGAQSSSHRQQQQQQNNNMSLPPSKSGQGLLSHRLADSHRQHKAGMPMSVPNPIPIHTVPRNPTRHNPPPMSDSQTSSAMRTPTSAVSQKFNVKANEFRPNPGAIVFKPVTNASVAPSPAPAANARSVSRPISPSAFFGKNKPPPPAERASILDHFNPLKRLKEIAEREGYSEKFALNGGIRHAYVTQPVWFDGIDGEDFKSYKSMFDDVNPASSRVSSHQVSPVNPPLPHQHQLPLHLQHSSHGVPQLHTPPQMPYQVPPQAHPYPSGPHQFDEHRMHISSSTQTAYPSPRMQNTNMAYASPMSQPAQLAYGQPVPQYFMGPHGPQPAQFRPLHGGPQMVPAQGSHMAAPMMVQQSSQGGFMAPPHGMAVPYNPQMPMYPLGQPPGYGGQSQPPSGYPSPGRGGAPMMLHQGSQQGSHQGQHPQMYMGSGQYGQPVYAQQQPPHMMPMRGYGSPQPHYNQSPQQQYHYPPQPHRAPSNSYGLPSQGAHHHMPAQHAPTPAAPTENGDDVK